MARQIKVDLVANARPFNNTLDAAVGRVTGFSSRLKAMGGGSIGKGLAIGAGVASFNLLTTAVSTAIGAMDEMHQAFLDDEASQARLQNVLKNSVTNYEAATKAVEDYAQAQLEMGFDDADTRDSVGQLAGVVKDSAEAIRLSGLASDIARAKNIDLAQATDIVTKAYNGQARGLAAIGVNVQGAVGGTELLARAFQNVKGAQEAYAKTGAGAVARANVKMQETMEKVGSVIDKVSQVVIPVMVAGLGGIVDAAGEIIAALTALYNYLKPVIIPLFDLWAWEINRVADALGFVGDVAHNVIGAISSVLGGGGGQQQGGVINAGSTPSGGVKAINIGKFGGSFASGGVVPGSGPTLIMAHGGETVTPKGQAGQTIIVNIASFIGSDRDIDRFSDRLAFRLRSTSLS